MITKHYSAEKMAHEISNAILRNLDRHSVSFSISKGVYNDWDSIFSDKRCKTLNMVEEIISEKSNEHLALGYSVERPYPGEYELTIEYTPAGEA